jgi:hypothetical protein
MWFNQNVVSLPDQGHPKPDMWSLKSGWADGSCGHMWAAAAQGLTVGLLYIIIVWYLIFCFLLRESEDDFGSRYFQSQMLLFPVLYSINCFHLIQNQVLIWPSASSINKLALCFLWILRKGFKFRTVVSFIHLHCSSEMSLICSMMF